MVSSRCVFGSSIGIRLFSIIATITKTNVASAPSAYEIYEPKYLAVPLKVVMKFDAIFIDHGPINGEVAMHLITRGIAI